MTSTSPMTDQRPSTSTTSIWRKPFTIDTWRRTAYLLAVGPLAVALVGAVIRWPRRGPALLGRLAEALGVVPRGAAVEPVPSWRVVAHALINIPVGAVSLVATAYGWALVGLNVAYPIRSGNDLSDAWGGPSLAGAWAVHAAGGLVFLFLVPWMIDGLTVVHRRLLQVAGITRRR